MTHNMAIDINPQWSDADIDRAKDMLIRKLAHQHDFDVDAVRRGATFTERLDGVFSKRPILICSFEPRTDVHVVWTRDHL